MTSFLSSCVSWLRFIYASLIKFTKQLIDPKYWWKLSIYDSEWVQGFKSYAGHCFYGVVARSGYSFTSFGRGTVCYFLVSTCVCVCVLWNNAEGTPEEETCQLFLLRWKQRGDRQMGGGGRWILCVFVLVCLNVCVCVRLLYLCDVASVRNG